MTSDRQQQSAFNVALESIEVAVAHRDVLSECWTEFCNAGGLDIELSIIDGIGRLDVVAQWPEPVALLANEATQGFASAISAAFDEALFTAASIVSASVQQPLRDDYRMPLEPNRAELAARISAGALRGLRPDQIQVLHSFQPYPLTEHDSDTRRNLRVAMQQFAQLVNPERDPVRSRVAVWAHSASPSIEMDTGQTVPCHHAGDGLLEDCYTVATFDPDGHAAHMFAGNPDIAFDPIFNDPHIPPTPTTT